MSRPKAYVKVFLVWIRGWTLVPVGSPNTLGPSTCPRNQRDSNVERQERSLLFRTVVLGRQRRWSCVRAWTQL